MKKKLEAWVIGGDGRYAWAARQLRRDGMPVKCWGVPGMENQAESLEMALEDADIVLLPMKPFRDESLIVCGEEIHASVVPKLLAEDAVLVDSTDMTPEQVVDAIIAVVEDVYGKRA